MFIFLDRYYHNDAFTKHKHIALWSCYKYGVMPVYTML